MPVPEVPVPLRFTTDELPVDEVLVSVNCPVEEVAVVGSNCTITVAVFPGLRVTGKVAPE